MYTCILLGFQAISNSFHDIRLRLGKKTVIVLWYIAHSHWGIKRLFHMLHLPGTAPPKRQPCVHKSVWAITARVVRLLPVGVRSHMLWLKPLAFDCWHDKEVCRNKDIHSCCCVHRVQLIVAFRVFDICLKLMSSVVMCVCVESNSFY